MVWFRDRRSNPGRRSADSRGTLALRGLLHDIGHDLATLSYLVEAVRGDPDLSTETRRRVDLIEQETTRLLDHIRHAVSDTPKPESVSVRGLVNQIVTLADQAHETSVVLSPGDPVTLHTDGAVLWRVVTNVVDNAVRAAGPSGRVQVSLTGGREVVIDVADDGPGFGNGPNGWSSMGMGIVTGLTTASGGSLDVQPAQPHGTRVRLTFPTILQRSAVDEVTGNDDDQFGAR
jgi:signal transduction histidine kinase